MAEAVAPKEDSPHVANLKFREKHQIEKIGRIEALSDQDFDASQGMSRKDALERAKRHLAEIKAELKKAVK